MQSGDRCHIHRGGEHVIGGLAAIDVVVGMHLAPLAANAPEQLAGAIGDHLVGVHVGLGSTSRLPNDERELIGELAGDDLVGRLDNRPGLCWIELLQL